MSSGIAIIVCLCEWGYKQALQKHGIPINDDLIIYPDFSHVEIEKLLDKHIYYKAGYQAMKKLLELALPPDAVFFASDILAYGALNAVREAGLEMPGDISFFGFDDERATDYDIAENQITTMRQPLFDAGYYGIKNLISCIESNGEKKQRIVLAVELVDRGSCIKR